LGQTFDSNSGIERIDGSQIAGTLEIRADYIRQDNLWDFSEIELVNVDVINGRKGHDSIIGSAIDDSIQGDSGRDTLDGGMGNDILDGGNHNDLLRGGVGIDTLIGGQGDDNLVGGAGADTFIFNSLNGIDTIEDFNGNENDIIQIDTSVFGSGDINNISYGASNGNLSYNNQQLAILSNPTGFDPTNSSLFSFV